MSAANDAIEQIRGKVLDITESLKRRVFGTNNENLDFVMDSFYKLEPAQRNGVLAGLIGGVGLFVLAAVWLYFAQVGSLKNELSQTFNAIHEFQSLKNDSAVVDAEFESLLKSVSKKTRSLKVKPFFEKLAKQHQVIIEGLGEQSVKLPADNPFADKIDQIIVEMRLPKISIPRLLNFLVEVEKSGKFLRVQDLQIQGRYGTKLFFDGIVKVRGYSVK